MIHEEEIYLWNGLSITYHDQGDEDEMKFDHLTNPDTDELIKQLVAHVTKTNDDLAQEVITGKKSTAELKLFIAKNDGFSTDDLKSVINKILRDDNTNDNPREFFESHHFSTNKLNHETYHLVIDTPKYERSDDFLIIESNGYLKALSVIRRKWTKKTVEKLIQYIDSLERLFITSDDLENLVEVDQNRDLTGFTAKYRPFYKDERVSVQVHGGTDEHLNNVESEFSARPKRIEFDQGPDSNSKQATIRQDGGEYDTSTDAVKAAVRQDGYASVPQVRAGSKDVGVKMVENVISKYEEINEKRFEVNHRPERIKPGERHFISQLSLEDVDSGNSSEQSDGGLPEELRTLDQGSVIEGVTIWHFEDQLPGDNYPDDRGIADHLEAEIFDYKDRYSYAEIQECNYLIYDRVCGESFEIIISDKKIRVYAKSNTTSSSFREFYNILDEDFNSTYSFEKDSKQMRA